MNENLQGGMVWVLWYRHTAGIHIMWDVYHSPEAAKTEIMKCPHQDRYYIEERIVQ